MFCTQTAHVWGGVENWLDDITRFLPGQGWESLVALAKGRRFHEPAAYRLAHPHIEALDLDGSSGTREGRVAAVREAIGRTRPDVVVPVSLVDPLEAVARAKLEGQSVRLFAVLHGFVPGALLDLRRYGPFLDMAVGVNRLVTRLLASYVGLAEDRARRIPYALIAPPTSVRAPRSQEIRLGYVGRLEQTEKRALDLIALAEALEARGVPFRLDVAGDGPCREALTRAMPADKTRLIGFVPSERLHKDVYPSLDCLLLFSPAEGSPHALSEAMYHGVVPVTSRFRGCVAENVVRDGETGLLFDVGDVAGAAAGIERLSRDRSLLEDLATRCRAEAQPWFQTDHFHAQWLGALEETLARPPSVGGGLPTEALQPSGTLEAWGLPPRVSASLRALLGRLPEAKEAGAEWPHCGPCGPEDLRAIEALAEELDVASVGEGSCTAT